MTAWVRSEDFDFDGKRLALGTKTFVLSSVISYNLDRRVSAELLGLSSLVTAMLACATFLATVQTWMVALPTAGILGFAIRREILRPFVLVLEIAQVGKVEARGFTLQQAETLQEMFSFHFPRDFQTTLIANSFGADL
jgi:hypothetical protein